MVPMWMSELSSRSGVPVATVKFYLRERLLPPGEAVGATRARYGEEHVRRLRLVRALVETAGMGLEQVRRVLAAMEAETTVAAAIGSAHLELSPAPHDAPSDRSRTRVAALLAGGEWVNEPRGRHATALASALDALDAAGQPLADDVLATYARAVRAPAEADLAHLVADDPTLDREAATTYAVLGTVLTDPVLLTLRRMAHEDLARRRLPGSS